MPTSTELRLQTLQDEGFFCQSCQTRHRGLFDLGASFPDVEDVPPIANDDDEVKDWKNILTKDICILKDEYFFVRCVLLLPIADSQHEKFGFGVWSSLSKENFERYMQAAGEGEQAEGAPWFGWFANSLRGYPNSFGLKCNIHPGRAGFRPYIMLEPTNHPLSAEQRDGITLDKIFELYKLYGHEMGA